MQYPERFYRMKSRIDQQAALRDRLDNIKKLAKKYIRLCREGAELVVLGVGEQRTFISARQKIQ